MTIEQAFQSLHNAIIIALFWDFLVGLIAGLGLHFYLCRQLAFFRWVQKGGSTGDVERFLVPLVSTSLLSSIGVLAYFFLIKIAGMITIAGSQLDSFGLLVPGYELTPAGFMPTAVVHGLIADCIYLALYVLFRFGDKLIRRASRRYSS